MFPKVVLSLMMFAAGAAHAQDIDLLPGPPDEVARAPREQLFISPAGEPFRAPPGQPYPVAGWFARADADHDGALTAAEFQADHLAFFKSLDTDGDGVVDGFEASTYEKDIVPELQPRDDRGAGMPRRKRGGFLGFGRRKAPLVAHRQGAGAYGLINEPLPVRAADADFDYKVTTAEQTAAALRRFRQLDRDKDGRIRLDELPKTPFQTRAEERRGEARPQQRLQPRAASAIPQASVERG